MRKQYPNKISIYVKKYIPLYEQKGEQLKEINKQNQLAKTSRTFFVTMENPTTTKIISKLDEIEEKIQHGKTYEKGWYELNLFASMFPNAEDYTTKIKAITSNMSYEEYSEAILHKINY